MTEKKTHYQVLGIRVDVPSQEIKRAYRELVKIQHPDTKTNGNGSHPETEAATEEMMRLNEAYATLMDRKKRTEYDCLIGLTKAVRTTRIFTSSEEEVDREKFLRTVFQPSRLAITKALGMYKKELHKLSADPFDDQLLSDFHDYADQIENALRKGSNGLSANVIPPSLAPAVTMMRYAIAQAADGLEEIRHFFNNYDYDHLGMAGSLFKIAGDLCKQSQELTRGR